MNRWSERLGEGDTLEKVCERDWVGYGEEVAGALASAELTADERAYFEGLQGRGLTAVMLGMDGCGDCRRYLPVLGAAARVAGMTVRAFDRDHNPDVMDLFVADGARRVPVFAVFADGREIARWIERPRAAQAVIDDARAKIPADDDPDRDDKLTAWRRARDAELDAAMVEREALREVREAIEAGLGRD